MPTLVYTHRAMPPSSGNNTPSATEFTSSMSENGEAASVTSKGEGSTSEKKNAGATFGFGPRDRRSRLPHNDLRGISIFNCPALWVEKS